MIHFDRWNRAVIVLFGLAVACAMFAPAQAHDWYPKECCHDNDCAPVESVARTSSLAASSELPSTVVTTKHGTAVLPPNLPRRESKDNRMHACMNPGPMGKMQLICIFTPPTLTSEAPGKIAAILCAAWRNRRILERTLSRDVG